MGAGLGTHTILDEDFDVEFLMFYLERSIDPTKLIGNETIITFRLSDLTEQPNWWLLVKNDKAQVCLKDPGKEVNVYFDCSVRTMHDVWMGDRTYKEAIRSGELKIHRDGPLTRNVQA